ncbi:MAG TPA: hypothetical protein VMN36_00190 [Verrucomicrobiales bacterium]|nr:hypothetical protein [Verrucomicrobiales bacterium]
MTPSKGILQSELAGALSLLRCPQTGVALRLATPEETRRAAAAHSGEEPVPEGGLATVDGCIHYPIREGFPILLLDAAVRIADVPEPRTGLPRPPARLQ